MIRVGVVGAGMMGKYFIRTINETIPGAEVVAVASRKPRDDGPRLTHRTPIDLIQDPSVDAVIVASPDDSHEEFVLACLASRKPVLCEKPLAPTAESCLRIVDAESELGQPLVQVGYMRRFDQSFRALKSAIDERSIGAPLLLHCAHRAPGPSRNRTTDLLMSNAAVHDFDAARWLLGDEIDSATVYLPPPSRLSQGKYDPLAIILRTHSGIVIDLEIFVNAAYGCEVKAEVLCESGTVALAPPHLLSMRYNGQSSLSVPQGTLATFDEAYRLQLRTWIDALVGGLRPIPSAWDGYVATAISDACRQSIATALPAPVNLADRPALYQPNTATSSAG